jgi:hypothetical protein
MQNYRGHISAAFYRIGIRQEARTVPTSPRIYFHLQCSASDSCWHISTTIDIVIMKTAGVVDDHEFGLILGWEINLK